MNNQQLIQVQRSIENFFYRVRVNIALHNVMKARFYKDFNKAIKLAIENQLLYIAKTEKINQIIGAQKNIEDLKSRIFFILPLLQMFVDQQDFADFLKTVNTIAVKSAKNILGIDKDFVIADLEKIIATRVTDANGWIDETTVNWIVSQLNKAMNDKMDSYEIAKLLRDSAKTQAEIRADTIAEQEAAWMLGETQMEIFQQAGIEKKRLITSRDEIVCPICIADEEAGEIGIDETFPSGAMGTPIHIHCIVGNQEILGLDVTSKIISEYDGPIIRITTEKGSVCTITPNHKMLTQRGWVVASKLKHSDNLFNTSINFEKMLSLNPNVKSVKSLIENVVIPNGMISSTMPSTSIDFDGDELFCKNVNIIKTNSSLRNKINIFRNEAVNNFNFIWTLMRYFILSTLSQLNFGLRTQFSTPNSLMSSLSIPSIFFGGALGHSQSISSKLIANLDLIANEKSKQSTPAHLMNFRKLIQGNPTLITSDKIISISKIDRFHGKVYDLETKHGWYSVNNIISHNCRCFVMPSTNIPLELQ